jgi:hypothetical protein
MSKSYKALTPAARRQQVKTAHEQMTAQIASLVSSNDWTTFLSFAAKFRKYSASNCLLILAQHPGATRTASLVAWNKLGRKVKKGEKGLGIFAPMFYKPDDDDNKLIRGFKIVKTYDVSQTQGAPLNDGCLTRLLEGEAPVGLYRALSEVAAGQGYTITRGSTGAASSLVYLGSKTITISHALSDADAVKTLTHELGYICQRRDARISSRARMEIEAESVAYIVCHAFGVQSAPYSIGYVADWAKGDLSVIKATADWVVDTAHAIIEEASINLVATELSMEDILASIPTDAVPTLVLAH